MTDAEKINFDRYNKLAYRLNHDSYLMQIKENDGKPLKHFVPCTKALVFTSALSIRPVPVTSIVVTEAAKAICGCHVGIGESELYRMLTQ